MVDDFEVVIEGCPFCGPKEISILLHNAVSDPEKRVDIIDDDTGDPRLKII